jgi:two-component system alkaline phosphatase synthesis response regulator PhoP
MQTVLVVDDEPKIARLARDYLEHAGFTVLTAGDGPSAVQATKTRRPDIVVLDLGLPGFDGLEAMRQIRASGSTPIVVLTARDTELDKLLGLELGADDYVTKPFSPRELVARIKAVLRRGERSSATKDRIEVGDLSLDVARLRVTAGGRPIDLTATEFSLLATMARDPGRVFTRSQLLDAVHGQAFEAYERAIDAHVKNIRRKLEPNPARPRYLQTVYGVGYRVAEPEPEPEPEPNHEHGT